MTRAKDRPLKTESPRAADAILRRIFILLFFLLSAPSPLLALDLGYRLAILPFKAREGIGADEAFTLTKILEGKIADDGSFQVIGVSGMGAVHEERVLQFSCLTDDTDVLELGRMLKADLLLTGSCGMYDGAITLSAVLLDISSGEAVSGMTRTIREESFMSDLGVLAAQICGEIETLRGEISMDNLRALIDMKNYTEAWRLALLAARINGDSIPLERFFIDVRTKQSALLAEELRREMKEAALLELYDSVPLLLSLAPDDISYADLVSKAYIEEERELLKYFDTESRLVRTLLRENRYEEAAEKLENLEAEGLPAYMRLPLEEALSEYTLERSVRISRLSLLQGKPRAATFAAYGEADPADVDSRLRELLIRSEERIAQRETDTLLEREKPGFFSPGTHGSTAVSAAAGYGAAGDPVAKYIRNGTGISLFADLRKYQPLLPPLYWFYGAALSASARNGSVSSSTGGVILMSFTTYSGTAETGAAFRFRDLDLEAVVSAGPTLIEYGAVNAGYAPALQAGFAVSGRWYFHRDLFAGLSISRDSFFTWNYPPVESWHLALVGGWAW